MIGHSNRYIHVEFNLIHSLIVDKSFFFKYNALKTTIILLQDVSALDILGILLVERDTKW